MRTPSVPTARVVGDAVGEHAPRICTLIVRLPRIILAEFNTHRVFSRNAASSRAIPFRRMVRQIIDDPFVPLHWGANQAGMQARGELGGARRWLAIRLWLIARWLALLVACPLSWLGLHKQVVNRLLEPWMWTVVCVTSTDWEGFFEQRCHGDAEPHMRMTAEAIRDAIEGSFPRKLRVGEWYLPLLEHEDVRGASLAASNPEGGGMADILIPLSVARAASTSYKTVDGFDMTPDRASPLYAKLVGQRPAHASPLEHQARVDSYKALDGPALSFDNEHLRGNLAPGWIQLRQVVLGAA